VFAGAAREAVFSRPAVIRRVKAHFVPVALKAGMVNDAPGDDEGRLYREIARSKIAPQGICVVNSAGKVLDWVISFDDDNSVLAFLDDARRRFARNPDAKRPVAARRHMKYPSARLADVEDNGKVALVLERHARGTTCPGKPLLLRGTVIAHVFGRALGPDGKPVADTVRQEHYVEDRFHIDVAAQAALARALVEAGDKRVRLHDGLARLLVSHAYLGQLDVNPVGAPGGRGKLEECRFWARRVGTDSQGLARLHIEGTSHAVGAAGAGDGGDGRLWRHEVRLAWEGLIELRQDRVTRVLLLAKGREKLRWGNRQAEVFRQVDVARLTAGHAIDLSCEVRYGLVGAPIPAGEATDDPAAIVQAPDVMRRHLVEGFGPAFLIFRAGVQSELKLSAAQKQKVRRQFAETVPDALGFFQNLQQREPADRPHLLAAYRQKVQEKHLAFLAKTLEAGQRERLRQLELQHEGLFALGRPDVARELRLSEGQRKQFMAVVQAVEKQVQPLIRQAESGANPEEIRKQMLKLRKAHEERVEAILGDAQKKQWQKMLGKPFAQ
jgi:hypothetical protein